MSIICLSVCLYHRRKKTVSCWTSGQRAYCLYWYTSRYFQILWFNELFWVLTFFWVIANPPTVHNGGVSRGRFCDCGWRRFWHVTGNRWHATCFKWHKTYYMWHLTREIWYEMNILVIFSSSSSLVLSVSLGFVSGLLCLNLKRFSVFRMQDFSFETFLWKYKNGIYVTLLYSVGTI